MVAFPLSLLDRASSRIGRPFDPRTSLAPPHGPRSSWVHYGVMVPGLPAPHRTFGVMSVVGTTGVAIFANDQAITTSARDTAYLVSATAAMSSATFHTYSIEKECAFADDGSSLRFGDDLLIEGTYPRFDLTRHHPEGDVVLHIEATDKVSHFIDLRGGLYSHWSLLCEYEGTVAGEAASGLCTFEYASGVGMHSIPSPIHPTLPARFFTYHVLNVDEATQILFTEVHGPGGIVMARSTYVRGLDDYGSAYPDTHFVVTKYDDISLPTPSGRRMRMPSHFSLGTRDKAGQPLLELEGRPHSDWAYGLGAGFVGSYQYDGTFAGREISGTGYIEYIDLA